MRFAYLNGQVLPEAEARISVLDRSFLYGDGLFETIRVYAGTPFRWTEHLERLRHGATFLGIHLPVTEEELHQAATELLARNAESEAVLRLHLSRGVGRRGYSPAGAETPTVVMTTHHATRQDPAHPTRWTLATSNLFLPPSDRLAAYKTANKLVQILARAEAESRGCDEALLLNPAHQVVEGASSNVFWLERGVLCTPPLAAGALPGITRAVVLELAGKLGLEAEERKCRVGQLVASEGVFLTLSSLEIVPALRLDGQALPESPLTRPLHEAYQRATRGD